VIENINRKKPHLGGKLLYIFSPNILSILMLLVLMIHSLIEMESSEGWSLIGIIIAMPVAGICLLIDLLLRINLKLVNIAFTKKITILWVLEAFCCLLIYNFYLKRYL
jgi:hypothetical protein